MQERNARELTREGAGLENGDIADIDFEGFVDGVAFEGGKAEHYTLTLGSGSFIPGFEDQIVGHSAGEEFDITVTFPEQYQAARAAWLARRPCSRSSCTRSSTRSCPLWTTSWQRIALSTIPWSSSRKPFISPKMQEQLDKQDDLAVDNAVGDQVVEGMEVETPPGHALTPAWTRWSTTSLSPVEQQGLRLEHYCARYLGQTVEQFRASFMPRRLRSRSASRLALEAVARAEGIVASDEDVDAE